MDGQRTWVMAVPSQNWPTPGVAGPLRPWRASETLLASWGHAHLSEIETFPSPYRAGDGQGRPSRMGDGRPWSKLAVAGPLRQREGLRKPPGLMGECDGPSV